MVKLKKNQINNILTVMVDKTDFATVESGLAADDINIKLYGVAQGVSTAASTITVSKAATLVRSGLFQITLKATETDAHDNYMLRLSSTSTVSCAPQYIPLEMVDYDDSDIYSLISDVDSQILLNASMISDAHSAITAVDSQLTVTHSLVSDIDSQLLLNASMISDAHSAITAVDSQLTVTHSLVSDIDSQLTVTDTAMDSQYSDLASKIGGVTATLSTSDISDIASRVWSEKWRVHSTASSFGSAFSSMWTNVNAGSSRALINQSRISDVDSALTSQFAVISNYLSNASNYLSNISVIVSDAHSAAAAGGATASAIANKVWSDFESKIGSTTSDMYSALAAGGGGATTSAIAAKVWSDFESKVGSTTSDIYSTLTAGGGGATTSAIADKVWSDYQSKVGASPSQVYSQLQSMLTTTYNLVSDVDSQLTVTDTALDSQFAVVSNYLSNASNYLSNASNYLSNLSAQVSNIHSLVSDVDSQLTVTDAALVSASNIASNVWNDVLTAARYNTANSAGRRLRNVQDFGIYDLASVWVDEVAGTSTGTTNGEDATVANRANDFDNAQTVAASVGLDRIHVQQDNSIALTATLNGYEIWGSQYTIALGSQDIGMTRWVNATVSGVGTGTSPVFIDCFIGTATLPPSTFYGCSFTNTLTMGSAGAYRLIRCQSGVAGAGAPTIDMGAAVGATTLELRDWRGGITLNNLQAGDVVTLDGIFGTITLNGSGGAVEIRGIYKAVTGTAIGSATVTETGIEGELTNSTIASQVWSNYQSVVGASASQVYSQIQSMITNTYELVSDVESQLDATDAVVDSAYSAIQAVDSQLTVTDAAVDSAYSAIQATDSQLTVTDAAINSRVNAQVVDVLRTDTIPDSYSTDGAQPTIAQAILAIHQFLQERSVSGTTVTVKKPDGSTTAQTFTLNDGTTPTSITRAT